MKAHKTNDTTTRVTRQTAHGEKIAELRNTAGTAMVNGSAKAAALQRSQGLANSSARAMQLKQQTESIAANPKTTPMQRFQRLADDSPRTKQLKQQAGVMTEEAAKSVVSPVQKASVPVVQKTLASDLVSGKTATAIAGETHGEISMKAERKAWQSQGVTVMYEHEPLKASAKKPDPPILRIAYGWISLLGIARDFWKFVEADQDVRGAAGVLDEQRTLASFIKDDLEDLGLAMDKRLPVAHMLLDKLCLGLPVNEEALMCLPRENQQYLAESKLKLLGDINALIADIHRAGSFSDVSFDEDSVRIERSREMLKTINSAKPKKTLYKVGDLHTNDMQKMNMPHDDNVAVFSRRQYLPEYEDADIAPSSGGKAVFNSIGDDML